jgi:branched-chain amino acid transport system ATP-binding protein
VNSDLLKVFTYFPILRERRHQLAGYLSGGEQQMIAVGRALMAKPKLMMLDEPSLGLAPIVVSDIFRIIEIIHREEGVAILLVEQNAKIALELSGYGYIMENGRVVMDAESGVLNEDLDIKEFYLGLTTDNSRRKNFAQVKHYKRRKRWLS